MQKDGDVFKTSHGTSGYVSDNDLVYVGDDLENPQSFTSTETLNFNESPQNSFLSLVRKLKVFDFIGSCDDGFHVLFLQDDDASSTWSNGTSSDRKSKVDGTRGNRPNLVDIGFIVEEKWVERN